ncbi:MAG: tRNA (N6-isopentenyl adenosine(37)-C2)-methylthiotransferase MiaB [Armatimonadetes bacterium]|nr:tRNA (N6-isopentenyl adenosine(37)-C2)-methylthiotransferase MiaB [Armatimonadota bacterium]
MSQKFYIQTFGCQMNVADTERISALLERAGAEPADRPDQADVILLNTCSVREKPEVKVYSRLGQLKRLKERNPDLILGVCGCQAQREGEAILRNAPFVDLVVGTNNVDRVPQLVEQVRRTGKPILALEMPERGTPAWMSPEPHMTEDLQELVPPSRPARGKLKAFVPVILGCDFACTFCIVPQTRGPERSRPVADVLREVRALAQMGTREIVLLGQTVDAYKARYHADDPPGSRAYTLADLLWFINDVDGIERVRFTSPHPYHMSQTLIEAIAQCPKACEWIHLPVQSGDNTVLKRMARRYTRERYLDLVARIREVIPGGALTTDIIVGFPGETWEQFENTLSLVEEVRFDGAFMFAYSPRPGTPAHGWDGEVPHDEKIARLNELIALQNRISREKNEALLGQTFEVLVEGPSGEQPGQYTGLTRTHKTVNFPGHEGMVGKLVQVRAAEAFQWGFLGEVVSAPGAELPLLAGIVSTPEVC